MRLERLDLTRYGRFTDARLEFPAPAPGAPDLHVIYGPNEAGKSTLFAGWLDLLYGIPLRTRYDFLHHGPTMQIGARLATAAGVMEVVRVKRNGPSLLDAQGVAVPEAGLMAALGGLGREGYGAMFSLDDDTLERGGESILASRGDLGEMLFSASAGLAGLGPQLDGLRKELDGFHRPGGRKTVVKALRDEVLALDRARREADTSASAVQKLQREAAAALKAWEAARAEEAGVRRRLEAVQAAQAVVPARARLARMQAEAVVVAGLPGATEADVQGLQALEAAAQGLAGQMATRAGTIAQGRGRVAALVRDPAVLPLGEAIAEATGLRPLHLAALADLPRRRDALAGMVAELARRGAALGLGAAPVVAPAVRARLRALVARRDVVMQARAAALAEVARAVARLARLGDPAPVEAFHSLGHLVARLRSADPEGAEARAVQDLAARDAELTAALALLGPWRGSAADLAALDVPPAWQVAAWEAEDAATRAALDDAAHGRDRAVQALALARQGVGGAAAGAPGLAEAAEARRVREQLWAAHLAQMTPASAAAFEAALRLDDRVSLHLAEAMALARQAEEAEQAIARAEAGAAEAEAAVQAAVAARQGHEQAVAAGVAALGLAGAGLADLKPWLALRLKALAAMQAQDAAAAARARAAAAVSDAAAVLAQALGLEADLGLARLWAEAMARLDSAERQRAARAALAEGQADLADRRADLVQAEAALAGWRTDWQAASAGTALATLAEDDPGLAAVLDELDQMATLHGTRAELADRIAKMEANSAAFRAAAATVCKALDLPADTGWDTIPARLALAQQAERDFAQLTADLTAAEAAQARDRAEAEGLARDIQALGDRLDWAGEGRLADHLAACLRATRLRADIAELAAELADRPAPDSDAATLEAEAEALRTAAELARAETEARFAALTDARRAVDAVGGDDAVARIVADRANLLHDLAEQARAHLARRFALMALEQGLRRYRDSHRSAMLARASEAFARLSRGAYAGLAAQPDGGSEVLVAVPAQGGAKLATDLSKGTRFQLYLALRIAGYHELAKARAPVPFIADDIMETFDDDRAEQAFALLGDMSRTGQVIYLTHHRHLCDMAQAICPGARVTELGGA